MTDASDIAVGAVLQQYIDGTWHLVSFFSKKMKPAETRYNTFDCELLAINLAIQHFRHFLEGREFHVFTDYKPLTFALQARPDRDSSHQARQLDSIPNSWQLLDTFMVQTTWSQMLFHALRLMPYSATNRRFWTSQQWPNPKLQTHKSDLYSPLHHPHSPSNRFHCQTLQTHSSATSLQDPSVH